RVRVRTDSAPTTRTAVGDYFLPSTVSFRAFAIRNFRTRLAGILRGSPVCGLRPMRALRLARTSLPKPGRTKPFLASLVARATRLSITSPTCFLERLAFWERAAIVADFVIILAMNWILRGWAFTRHACPIRQRRELIPQPASPGYRRVKRNSPPVASRRQEP